MNICYSVELIFSVVVFLKQLNYQWQKTGQFFLSAITYNLSWDPQGWCKIYTLLMEEFSICFCFLLYLDPLIK